MPASATGMQISARIRRPWSSTPTTSRLLATITPETVNSMPRVAMNRDRSTRRLTR
jgi:hypothetical protein